MSATEFFGAVQTAFEKAYADERPWGPGSVHVTSSGPMQADLRFDDRDGHRWQGTITVETVPNDSHQFVVRIATARNVLSE
jgi:hypothetical protein